MLGTSVTSPNRRLGPLRGSPMSRTGSRSSLGPADRSGLEAALLLSFPGTNRGVTGSCHLLESGGRRVLVDCGLFQGNRELEEENTGAFGFDPASIDVMLLTHAHLD